MPTAEKVARATFIWKFDEYCVVGFQIGSLEWRLRFAASAADWAGRLVGHTFPARQWCGTTFINPYGYDDPNATCWLEARRGV